MLSSLRQNLRDLRTGLLTFEGDEMSDNAINQLAIHAVCLEEVLGLEAKLADTELQRSMLVDETRILLDRVFATEKQRDRLRDLLETMVSISPYGVEWRRACQEARDAMKGEGDVQV